MIRKEVKRWLKALRIAKIIFEDQGYHTLYLEEIERFIKRKLMYNPKVKEEYIPMLFKISASKRIPMAQLVNRIIKDYLDKNGVTYERKSKTGSGEHYPEL